MRGFGVPPDFRAVRCWPIDRARAFLKTSSSESAQLVGARRYFKL